MGGNGVNRRNLKKGILGIGGGMEMGWGRRGIKGGVKSRGVGYG